MHADTMNGKKSLVVGFGSIGRRHAEVLRSLGCYVSVVSRHAESADVDHPLFSSIEKAFETNGYEYVVICTRTSEHYSSIHELHCIGFSGMCLVEKPVLADTHHEIPAVDFQIQVAYLWRFHPCFIEAQKILQSQQIYGINAYIGQYMPEWRPSIDYRTSYSAKKDQGGGIIRDASHELDLIQCLSGRWKQVSALGGHVSHLEIDSDDQFMVLLTTEKCPSAFCHLSALDWNKGRRISIDYANGSIGIDFLTSTIVHNKEVMQKPIEFNTMMGDMHKGVFSGAGVCSLEEGLSIVNLIEAAERSSEQKEWVQCQN